MRTGGRGAAWAWGAVALVAVGAAAMVAWRAGPSSKAGEFDPVGAVIGLLGLAVGAFSAWMSVRAARSQESLEDAAARLAGAVLDGERTARRRLLGEHDKPIDVRFSLERAPAHNAEGAGRRSRLTEVVDYYRGLSPQRMVITGAPGAGKTVLAVELILGLLEQRRPGERVPVRISAASLDTELSGHQVMERWLSSHLTQVYRERRAVAEALVAARLVVPVIDGLDEMDAAAEPGYDSRAGRVLRAINTYQDVRGKGAVVLTCRTAQYQALQELLVWAKDAARVEIAPVDGRQARAFLDGRVDDAARWEPVLQAIRRAPRGPLADGLSTPWRLTLAATVYEQRVPGTAAFARDPAELTDARLDSPSAVRDHLLELFIPATVALDPPPGHADAGRVHRWLATLAGYLDTNTTTGRTLGGRVLSGTDIVLHELWPLAGARPRLLTTATIWLLGGAATLPRLFLDTIYDQLYLGSLILMALTTTLGDRLAIWPEPARVDPRRLRTRAGRRIFVVWLVAGLVVGLAVGPGAGLVVDPGIGLVVDPELRFVVSPGAGLGVGLAFGLVTGLSTSGTVSVGDPRDLVRADLISNLVFGLPLGILSGLAFGFPFGIVSGLAVGIVSGLTFGLTFGLAFDLAFPLAGVRYVALLVCTRRWNAVWLPWRLGRLLHWATGAGLMRVAGIGYQFRHRELQDYLAAHPVPQVTGTEDRPPARPR
ncbi:NACHT domain-containing protein [Sphaerisporangium rhizosphaerae]|uniref:NACHT domain-containing protein n=1 Tax=Sphaerisporangium rhizosphaerae TaxID=2269375 RepID=A0ABW2PJF8_9ACTN